MTARPRDQTARPGGANSETQEGTKVAATGFVLAGGQSSRMGRDKALVEFEGRPLVERAIGILKAAGVPAYIAGSREEVRGRLESYAPVIPDAAPGLGPLAGVCAALRSTSAPHSVFLPVDVPLMPSSLIQYLLHHARVTGSAVTVTSVNGFAQTFPAVVARETLPGLEGRLHDGELGCLRAFRAAAVQLERDVSVLPVEVLLQSGQVAHPEALPLVHWFLNVNSAPDLAWLHRLQKQPVP